MNVFNLFPLTVLKETISIEEEEEKISKRNKKNERNKQ